MWQKSIWCTCSRANETHEKAERRRSTDNEARKNKLQAMSPESMKKHREKERLRKAKQREAKKCPPKVIVKIPVPHVDIAPIVEDSGSKLSEIEKIRECNIAEWRNLFEEVEDFSNEF